MSSDFIMQMRPIFGIEERDALHTYMEEGGFLTEFKRTRQFEEMIEAFTGAKHCVIVNNGTISLTLAALALGIGPGDEVIVPNYTMIATPNSVSILGAKPKFVDVEPDTLVLSIHEARAAITPKTKAIMLVSANGRYPSCGVEKWEALSEETGIPIIEDAAQSLGSFYPDGRHIGLAGAIGSFSFSAPKIISTGQGGACITNDAALAEKMRRLKDFGRSRGGNDVHDSIGFNFKFTELQACVGIEQMKKLPARIERKKQIWREYQQAFASIPQVELFAHDLQHTVPWFIDSKVEDREALSEYLQLHSIGTRVMYPPINRQDAYRLAGTHRVSEDIGKNGLWFPSSVDVTVADIERISEKVKSFYSK